MPDRVPFAIWNNKLPGEPINSLLLKAQACIINKSTVYRVSAPGIKVQTEHLPATGPFARTRKIYHTPAGTLTTIERQVPGSVWLEKMPFSGPDDYEPLEAYIRSKCYTPCYNKFLADDLMYPGQSVARPQTIYTPLQELLCKYMGVEAFCVEWNDRRDRLLELCKVIEQDRQKRLDLVADSPAHFVIIEGNVIAEVTGPERFEKYHIPYIEEACQLLHRQGKLAGAHLDADNKLLAHLIARTSLDLVESFTPPPDCNLPLPEARRLWPDKTIQINFPSSLHLSGPESVEQAAVKFLKEAAPGKRFIVAVSEDIYSGGQDTLVPLARTVYENGRVPIPTD